MLTTEKIAEFLVFIENPIKGLLMFMVFLYVVWFWKVGPYDGMMMTLNTFKALVEKFFIAFFGIFRWLFLTINRMFRVIFATVRDFFISRI